jgi:hypothetical protein
VPYVSDDRMIHSGGAAYTPGLTQRYALPEDRLGW